VNEKEDEPEAALTAVSSFMACINQHDVQGLVDLMTEDHLFVDSLGATVSGREAMRGGWNGYFRLFPDYHVEVEMQVARGGVVLACGTARGTYGALAAPPQAGHEMGNAGSWSAPAAWRAVVRGGHIAAWQIYCDNEPARRVLAANA
jgi:ketosteroid isomerase-like protein